MTQADSQMLENIRNGIGLIWFTLLAILAVLMIKK